MSSPALALGDDISGSTRAISSVVGSSGNTNSMNAVNHVIVHAVALFHILDHHSRRQEEDGRVIGTLLGRRLDGTGTIEITNCFAVPHAERGDEVAIGKDFNKKMLNLHKRTNRKEAIVGWYASAASPSKADNLDGQGSALITDTSSLIHEFYASESDEDEPVHLVVDTRFLLTSLTLSQPSIMIRAYKSTPVIVQNEHLGNLFHELRLTLQSSEPESICLHEMMKSEGLSLLHGSNGQLAEEKVEVEASSNCNTELQKSLEKLYHSIDSTLSYVDDVIEGKTDANAEIGRQIADALATVPCVRQDVFDNLFHDTLQDLLMITYLANITRTQIKIADKLNASLSG